jgi:hypothetical protein
MAPEKKVGKFNQLTGISARKVCFYYLHMILRQKAITSVNSINGLVIVMKMSLFLK